MNKPKIIVFLILLVLVFSLGIFNFSYVQGACSGSASTGDTCFVNPLTYNTVKEVTDNILSSLKNIVAVLAILFIVIGGLMYIFSAGDEKKIETAKKIITGAVIGFAIVLIAPSLLYEIGKALGWSGNTTATSLSTIANNVLKLLLSISGIIAIIFLVVGGLTYMTAYGEEKRAETGKKIITNAIIGIALIMGALVIVNQVSKLFS
jgi:type IV secretory pathway VirB2 component (pilin)